MSKSSTVAIVFFHLELSMFRSSYYGCLLFLLIAAGTGCNFKKEEVVAEPVAKVKETPQKSSKATPEDMEAAAKIFRERGGIIDVNEHLSSKPLVAADLSNSQVT